MNEENLIKYYNKFNEEKRLKTRHGQIELKVTLHYIEQFLKPHAKIIDIGAGAGIYSKILSDQGYDVTAVELVKHNLRKIESLGIKAINANATNLSMFSDNSFDITLLMGPMYHLINDEDLIKALNEAKRITKKDGIIFVQYCMNEYAILTHGIKEQALLKSLNENLIDENFHITPKETDLYKYVRLEDINYYNDLANLKRIKIISPEGPTDYIRNYINNLTEEEFNKYYEYILSICERKDLLGAGSHLLDILKKD